MTEELRLEVVTKTRVESLGAIQARIDAAYGHRSGRPLEARTIQRAQLARSRRDRGYTVAEVALEIEAIEVGYPDRDLAYPINPRFEPPVAESHLGRDRWDAAGNRLASDHDVARELRALERRVKAAESALRRLEQAVGVASPVPRTDDRVELQRRQIRSAKGIPLQDEYAALLSRRGPGSRRALEARARLLDFRADEAGLSDDDREDLRAMASAARENAAVTREEAEIAIAFLEATEDWEHDEASMNRLTAWQAEDAQPHRRRGVHRELTRSDSSATRLA